MSQREQERARVSEPERASSQHIIMHDNERDIGSQNTLILKVEADPAVYPA